MKSRKIMPLTKIGKRVYFVFLFFTSRPVHSYHLDESISIFRGFHWMFPFFFPVCTEISVTKQCRPWSDATFIVKGVGDCGERRCECLKEAVPVKSKQPRTDLEELNLAFLKLALIILNWRICIFSVSTSLCYRTKQNANWILYTNPTCKNYIVWLSLQGYKDIIMTAK